MSRSSVLRFLEIQHDVGVSEETLKTIEKLQKTRRDIHKILWELRYQMTRIDDLFAKEENYEGIENYEQEELEHRYEIAEKKCYEIAGSKR
ncbi:hypothetical protein KBB89_00565 [Candidatus Gracilibacteria bacterium]|nr:hypothetical protein [Candidatus Gracilibacteria bacterium]